VEYRSLNPDGKAIIKAAAYVPPHELPSADYPFQLTTGRTLYHFHTRTKTGRAPQLSAAAPDVWVEVAEPDAGALGLAEGDWVAVVSARGRIEARARISGVRPGVLFVPFHYGYWDGASDRAANELTLTEWDAASKQPLYKTAAARIEPLGRRGDGPAPAPTNTASKPVTGGVPPTRGSADAMVEEQLPAEEVGR
jgi:predicted molibdopterin-dependent oxidoreductase YjgC